MSRITQKGATGPIDVFQSSTDASLETLVGSRFDLSDGREVVLVQAEAATTVSPGLLYQGPAIVPNHQNLDVTAVQAYSANGNTPATVTMTLGATAATANQYAGGFLVVNDNNGEGQTLKIASHPAAASAGSLTVTLEDSPSVAITAASEACLIANQANGIIINPTTPTGAPVGVGLYTIAAAGYGFVVCKGTTSILADGALTVGSAISPSNAVAGAVENGVIAQGFVGNALQAGVDTEYRTVTVSM